MENWVKVLLAGAGLCIGYCVHSCNKFSRAADSIGMTVDNLARNTPVNVEESVINKAVNCAVDREVGIQVGIASQKAIDGMRTDISNRVRSAVEASYSDISKDVTDRIAKNISRIDEAALKRDVTEKAKAAIMDKFDGKLDDILDEFNGNLSNVSKIYESIANTITRKPEKEMTFRIG